MVNPKSVVALLLITGVVSSVDGAAISSKAV